MKHKITRTWKTNYTGMVTIMVHVTRPLRGPCCAIGITDITYSHNGPEYLIVAM